MWLEEMSDGVSTQRVIALSLTKGGSPFKLLFHRVFLVALGQVMQDILCWGYFKCFSTDTNMMFNVSICIIIKQDMYISLALGLIANPRQRQHLRNTSKAVLRPQYTRWPEEYSGAHTAFSVFLIF